MRLFLKLNTYWRLGLVNLWRVFFYLLRLKSGWIKAQMPIQEPVSGEFFVVPESGVLPLELTSDASYGVNKEPSILGWYKLSSDAPPDWFKSILSSRTFTLPNQHWSGISDFDSGVGDIKGLWEPSRFGWALHFCLLYINSKDKYWLNKTNEWINDWSGKNPANAGPNWKCAQETSIRVLHLAAGSMLLKRKQPSASMAEFIQQHLSRILPTMGYALAQDNNHGTSEAAALYVGGSWLRQVQPSCSVANKAFTVGRKYLVERASRLIMDDGSFSQYSLTYHRLMLDTLSFTELWRRFLALEAFPVSYEKQLVKASEWLYLFVDKISGDGPNLGANDGAHILNFTDCEYRDFKPSVELACLLFLKKTAYGGQLQNKYEALFGLIATEKMANAESSKLPEGGYGLLFGENAWCSVNVPHFEFRPSQADNLHLDFWLKGENILRDAGSYSYNAEQKWLNYFSASESHNTAQFDYRDQMPKVSRFLFGNWPKFSKFEMTNKSSEANLIVCYTDWLGAVHERQVFLEDNRLVITDTLTGIKKQATLRWRLINKEWVINNHSISSENITMDVTANVPIVRFALAKGYESRYYGKKQAIPVLEIDVKQNAQITTIIHWT